MKNNSNEKTEGILMYKMMKIKIMCDTTKDNHCLNNRFTTWDRHIHNVVGLMFEGDNPSP